MLNLIKWTVALEPLTIASLLLVLCFSTVFGLIISIVYHFTHRKIGYDRSLLFTLMIMPLVVTIIVILVSNNLARAFSLAGVFTLVRFRLAMNDSSDLAYILASVGTGLSAALGYLSLGLMITTFLAAVLFVLSTFLFKSNDRFAKLIVTMPEHLNLKDKLNKTIEKHTKSFKVEKFRTSDFGTLYKITYRLVLEENLDEKKLFDEIRLINGNLDIQLYEDYQISQDAKN